MKILGIDPGLATTGFGIIEKIGSKFTCVEYGTIDTPAGLELSSRLELIAQQLNVLFLKYYIYCVAMESLFFKTNKKTAMLVAQARGVLLLTSRQHNKQITAYTPPQVKTGVCGYGRAEKKQVQYMVQKLLNLDKIPKPDDAADGLALAICHAHSSKLSYMSKK